MVNVDSFSISNDDVSKIEFNLYFVKLGTTKLDVAISKLLINIIA